MSLDQVEYGAGGGIIAGIIYTVLVAMGLKERVKSLENNKLSKDVFEEYRGGVEKILGNMEVKIDKMDIKLDILLKK